MKIQDIERLANLARIELSDTEKQTYLREIGAILIYVDQIKGVIAKVGEERQVGEIRNVMREDDRREDNNIRAEDLIAEFPLRKNNYLQVKKIL